ncbi:hypothetical protein OOZ15_12385 [Galbibacter sp. EGI 63066]|uniref:MauE/DoxX family redox-associated membrane protein n=1 Tax=Galbibacter sp. EGI 63066 TaxID=2993559 RepID=UPI002248C320|nr:MauE/DoxX family redox-associated membrane protein [Galbibacter sp. EGI 63066]MCX2680742.1 hypothetical protein [Galbibacter sp. EGI 63066]
MKLRKVFPVLVSYLFILLFVYAAVSKLLDFENFRIQLGQSPLLSAFASTISWSVPLLELAIASMLIVPKFRRIGLYMAFTLMVMFTAYIFIILNYSIFVPCSCGGVLEKMGWKEHLLFNVCFAVLAFVGLFLMKQGGNSQKVKIFRIKSFVLKTLSCFLGGVFLVTTLYLLSEQKIHRNNAFTRRYLPHPILNKYELPIKYNSYYLAGHSGDTLYLGNTTAPLHLLQVNLNAKDTVHVRIKLNRTDFPLRTLKVNVQPPYFFVMDGTVPCIFRGSIKNWEADVWMKDKAYFRKAFPVDSNTICINTISSKTQMATLGLIGKSDDDFNIRLNPEILEKQIDGIFDVNGIMTSSSTGKAIGYIYSYRNQFMIMDSNLNLLKRLRTIDTVQKAQIKLTQHTKSEITQMKAPPLLVNKMAAMSERFLFVGSDRLGKNEDKSMLKEASIIDVYDWKKETYEFSFYLYNIKEVKVRKFGVYGRYLVALAGDWLSIYELRNELFTSNEGKIILSADSGKRDRKPVKKSRSEY